MDALLPGVIEAALAGAILVTLAFPIALLLRRRAGFLLWGAVLLPLFVPDALLLNAIGALLDSCPRECGRWLSEQQGVAALLALPFAVFPAYLGLRVARPDLIEAARSLGTGAVSRFITFRFLPAIVWLTFGLLLAGSRYAWLLVETSALSAPVQWSATGASFLLLALLARAARGAAP